MCENKSGYSFMQFLATAFGPSKISCYMVAVIVACMYVLADLLMGI